MKFNYKARTKGGKLQKGSIDASSREAALHTLEKYELFIISLNEAGKENIFSRNITLGRISPDDIAIFTRQLSVMLKAGISPVKALRAQVAQIENPDFREKIVKIAEKVEGGSSLSQVFSLFPKVFNQFFVTVIKSGEATGKVADSLNYLADHLERENALRKKIKGAMIYPAFVIAVFIGVIFLAAFFIIPKLTEVLKVFEGDLPWSTKAVMYFSDFIKGGGWIFLLLLVIVIFLLPRFVKKSEKYKKIYDKIILKLPIIGNFQKKVYLAQISENLSVLIASGLPITQALNIVEGIVNNTVYKEIVHEAGENVSKGEKISSVLASYPDKIPSFVFQMISTGEETGQLDKTLMDIVRFYRREIEQITDNLSTILEPVLILFLGIGVAILAVSVFIPLFKMGLGGM